MPSSTPESDEPRRPLDPIPGPVLWRLTSGEVDGIDLSQELQDVLAELGLVVSLATIRSWDGQQYYAAVQWARAMKARQAEPPDVPAKPAFIP